MKDQLAAFHEFANKVAAALNAANVRPDTQGKFIQAVLLMVGREDHSEEPYGGSLNYDDKKDVWVVDVQMGEVSPINLNEVEK